MRWLAAVAGAGTLLLVALRWDEVLEASSAAPAWAFAPAVALHAATLALRSEAWRLVLAAITGDPLPRTVVHGANAGAFVVGVAQSHAALPARVALLARLQPGAIRPAHVALGDIPIVAIEVALSCLLVAAAALALRSPWVAPGAIAVGSLVLVGLRLLHARFAHRPVAAGLAVLAHRRLRVALSALLALVTLVAAVRLWMLLVTLGLPSSLSTVALLLVSMGIFGLLPLGPGASPAGAVAALGASGLASALGLGLIVSATSICAVLLYGAAVAGVVAVDRGRRVLAAVTP